MRSSARSGGALPDTVSESKANAPLARERRGLDSVAHPARRRVEVRLLRACLPALRVFAHVDDAVWIEPCGDDRTGVAAVGAFGHLRLAVVTPRAETATVLESRDVGHVEVGAA